MGIELIEGERTPIIKVLHDEVNTWITSGIL
jgi:hypothetical protein